MPHEGFDAGRSDPCVTGDRPPVFDGQDPAPGVGERRTGVLGLACGDLPDFAESAGAVGGEDEDVAPAVRGVTGGA